MSAPCIRCGSVDAEGPCSGAPVLKALYPEHQRTGEAQPTVTQVHDWAGRLQDASGVGDWREVDAVRWEMFEVKQRRERASQQTSAVEAPGAGGRDTARSGADSSCGNAEGPLPIALQRGDDEPPGPGIEPEEGASVSSSLSEPNACVAPCLNPHLHGSMSVGQRCVCGFEAPPGMPHDFVALIVTGNDAGSKDTISQCARCNLVRHDYEYDGGKRSPNYPTHHLRGMGVVDRGCPRGDMAEDRAAMAGEADSSSYNRPVIDAGRRAHTLALIEQVRAETIGACLLRLAEVWDAYAAIGQDTYGITACREEVRKMLASDGSSQSGGGR